jgi:hypothetical protein
MSSGVFVDGLGIGELMTHLVDEHGWTEIRIYLMSDKEDEVRQWLEDNCVSAHISQSFRYVFSSESDAIAFTLKWA